MATLMDEWRVLPRLAFLCQIILTWQVCYWFMDLPAEDRTIETSGFVSIVTTMLSASFAIWLNKEKT